MLNRSSILAVSIVFLFSADLAPSFGQSLPAPPRDNNLNLHPPTPPPDFILKVSLNEKKIPKNLSKVYQQAQGILNQARLTAPDDRLRYFRMVISPDSTPVSGWTGFIESIRPAEEGVVVTLQVSAVQDRMVDSVHLLEHYSIVGRQVHYLGFSLPPPYHRFQVGF